MSYFVKTKHIHVLKSVKKSLEHNLGRAALKSSLTTLLIDPIALHSKTDAGHLEPN